MSHDFAMGIAVGCMVANVVWIVMGEFFRARHRR